MTSNAPSLARIAVRSGIWFSLGTYLTQIIGFVATLVMTRLLTPEVFGFFSLGLFWSALLNLRSKTGLSYAAVRQPQTGGALLGTYLVLDAIASLGSILLAIAVTAILSQLGYPPEVTAAILLLLGADLLLTLVSPLIMALEKELQLSRLSLVGLIAAIIAYTVAIVMALSGFGIWSLLIINIIVSALSLAGVVWVCKRRWPQAFQFRWRFDASLARQLFRQGLPTGLSLTALNTIVIQFDNFLIGTFVGYTTLGFYDRAYRIAHWPNLLLTIIVARVGFLTFARVRSDRPRLTHAVRLALWALSTFGIPIALILFFGAPDIIGILYGPRWSESAVFLRFLTIYSLVWPYVHVGLWLSIALGHGRTTLLFTGAQAITLIGLGTPLTIGLGVSGTLIGVAFTMLVAFGLSCRYIFRQVPLGAIETFGPPVVAACIAFLALLVVTSLAAWQPLLPIVRLIAISGIGAGVFFAVLYALRPVEMIERIRYLRRSFRPQNSNAA